MKQVDEKFTASFPLSGGLFWQQAAARLCRSSDSEAKPSEDGGSVCPGVLDFRFWERLEKQKQKKKRRFLIWQVYIYIYIYR